MNLILVLTTISLSNVDTSHNSGDVLVQWFNANVNKTSSCSCVMLNDTNHSLTNNYHIDQDKNFLFLIMFTLYLSLTVAVSIISDDVHSCINLCKNTLLSCTALLSLIISE